MASPLEKTEMEFLLQMHKTETVAKVISIVMEDSRLAVLLDKTVLYAQGGGQPSDKGSISSMDEETEFIVEDVRNRDGILYHYGYFSLEPQFKGANFRPGQEVMVQVDNDLRNWHSRLHSAGHLIDACIFSFPEYKMEATKAYHFPDGPFVEYKGVIPKDKLEETRVKVEEKANILVKTGGKVQCRIVDYLEAEKLCGGKLPDYIPRDSKPRIVEVGGVWCPCGGTHVKDIKEIGDMKIPQVRVKKGSTKVSYLIEKDFSQ